ncbi:PAS domain-containing hybrid sensor histidine kinase/response regulator [Nitrosophilus kaiyonis]|uniref:PAS domain-containing hybrid sensor histidine kinase/response regulator n=1 Tax=Nitrosophilus kaiyonis TaxID=2930200 RepID=UPI0024911CA2|nr:hybrid sensor histidine kinase/response regulator [Nitrosophilus kaiyonis]
MENKKLNYLLNILKNSNDHIFILKPDFTILSLSEKVKNLLGYSAENIVRKSFLNFLDKNNKSKIEICLDKIVKSDNIVECNVNFKLQNGAKIETQIESIRFKLNSECLILMRIKNGKKDLKNLIEKSMQQELGIEDFTKKIEQYFKLIQKEAKIGIWEIRLEDMKVYWSDEMFEILGLDKRKDTPEILPKSDMVAIEDKIFVSHVFDNSIKEKENYKITYRIKKPNGETKYLDEHAIYIDDEDGAYLLGFDIDVTDREKYQKKLLKQKRIAEELKAKAEQAKKEAEEANRARSIFLSNISHEIRTLLNAILGYSQILKNESSLNDRQKRMVESILIAGGHLLDLINDILDITKMEMGKNKVNLVEFNLTNMFKSLFQIFKVRAENKNIGWKIKGMPKEELVVYTDKTKLFHILLNLIGNAIKFTEKGKVELIFKYKNNNICYFEVKDTGIGIEKELLEKIFEPFIQNEEGYKRGGTGLGLAIANSNVKLLGGNLTVESKVGEGTRFFFEIPCGEIKKVKLLSDESFDNGLNLKNGKKLKVLIADDIEDNRIVLKDILEQKGIEVIEAKDGNEAVELFEKNRPDLIFMDIKMPNKNGVEAAKDIKNIDKNAKIVSLSASSFFYKNSYLYNVFNDDITKPFQISDLDKVFLKYFPDLFAKETKKIGKKEKSFEKIDENLKNQIISLAQIGNISELRKLIDEIGNDEIKETLSRYLRNFELDKIIKELKNERQK